MIKIIVVIFDKDCIFIIDRELFLIHLFRHINFVFVFITFFDVSLKLIRLFFQIERVSVFDNNLK